MAKKAAPRLEPEMLDNVEVLELLGKVQSGDLLAVPALFRALFGADGYEAVKEHLRDGGTVRASAMVEWLVGQIEECGSKN